MTKHELLATLCEPNIDFEEWLSVEEIAAVMEIEPYEWMYSYLRKLWRQRYLDKGNSGRRVYYKINDRTLEWVAYFEEKNCNNYQCILCYSDS